MYKEGWPLETCGQKQRQKPTQFPAKFFKQNIEFSQNPEKTKSREVKLKIPKEPNPAKNKISKTQNPEKIISQNSRNPEWLKIPKAESPEYYKIPNDLKSQMLQNLELLKKNSERRECELFQ